MLFKTEHLKLEISEDVEGLEYTFYDYMLKLFERAFHDKSWQANLLTLIHTGNTADEIVSETSEDYFEGVAKEILKIANVNGLSNLNIDDIIGGTK